MFIKDIPHIVGVDKIRVYYNNQRLIEHWINGASMAVAFEEKIELQPWAKCEIEYMEICIEGCLSEVVCCEIFLKG